MTTVITSVSAPTITTHATRKAEALTAEIRRNKHYRSWVRGAEAIAVTGNKDGRERIAIVSEYAMRAAQDYFKDESHYVRVRLVMPSEVEQMATGTDIATVEVYFSNEYSKNSTVRRLPLNDLPYPFNLAVESEIYRMMLSAHGVELID